MGSNTTPTLKVNALLGKEILTLSESAWNSEVTPEVMRIERGFSLAFTDSSKTSYIMGQSRSSVTIFFGSIYGDVKLLLKICRWFSTKQKHVQLFLKIFNCYLQCQIGTTLWTKINWMFIFVQSVAKICYCKKINKQLQRETDERVFL